MKASELRLGNIVKSLNPNIEWCLIYEIKENEIHGIRRTVGGTSLCQWNNSTEQLQGLLLSESWLLKFGFFYDVVNSRYVLKITENFYLAAHQEEGQWCIDIVKAHIQYVHELQNLFFALTKEEIIKD